jgi:hypothetical protein
MIPSEFKHLNKEQLYRRVKIRNVLIPLFAAIGIAAPVVFFSTDYQHNWSWLLIGLTYILLAIDNARTNRRTRAEILKREDRLKKSQQASPQSE